MKKICFLLSACATFAMQHSFAQELKYCGTDEMVRQAIANDPQLALNQQQLEQYTEAYRQQNPDVQSVPSPIYYIPIVFHIIHEYGAENISDAQIEDEVNILNRDYFKLNADTSAIVPQFQSIASDAGIQFRLARKDPNGNCTTGIDRIVSPLTY